MHADKIEFFICPSNAHNSYKIVKLLKSFKIITVAPTCFGLHKPASGSSQRVLRQRYKFFISVFNQLYAQNLFHNKFYFMPLHVSSTCVHHQEIKIAVKFFISVFNQLDAQNLFHNKFYFMPLHVSSTCTHQQEVKIALHNLWYHHTYR